MSRRFDRRREIEALDPVRDHQRIYRISMGLEFPWDYKRSLEFALFRTYCVPSISALLAATGEFEHRPQKRYDDTALLIAEMAEHGYDSPRGKEALRVVNRAHGQFAISNEDMLFVLSTFVFDPIDWIARFGWRPLTEHERIAGFQFYREVGKRMNIADIPADFDTFHRFYVDYQREQFVFSDTNKRIGSYTVNLFSSWYPAVTRPLVRKLVHGLLDENMARAFGFSRPPEVVRAGERLGLRARAAVVRLMPPRKDSKLAREPGNRTYPGYPEGYRPSDLGAPPPPDDLDDRWRAPARRA
ncbi:MAG TPA: oxygenase MpaB family protein [Pseudonocardiaceae bacterium]|jgi:hypothetical protein|nr:oxygenase MpaB family protein [Pseudonocardiaceae bacterium]